MFPVLFDYLHLIVIGQFLHTLNKKTKKNKKKITRIQSNLIRYSSNRTNSLKNRVIHFIIHHSIPLILKTIYSLSLCICFRVCFSFPFNTTYVIGYKNFLHFKISTKFMSNLHTACNPFFCYFTFPLFFFLSHTLLTNNDSSNVAVLFFTKTGKVIFIHVSFYFFRAFAFLFFFWD